jgi:hypothetical protein
MNPLVGERARRDPVWFIHCLWPEVRLYREQRQIIESVKENDETVVCAGNVLGS